ncbi:universal stress protein [Arenibacter latericius]|uniref:universal stress protein n=1 Tax=Arenibacter latericius TaxID=86104 RepID=UPI000403DA48|nr:universal stress protein [Arenibacter latericius]
MKQLEKILVPVDINGDYSEQINTAIKIARVYNSEIIITHVLSEEARSGSIGMKRMLLESVNEALDKINDTFKKERIITKKPIIKHGKLIDNILKTATKQDVNLIVAGSGCKVEHDRHKLGSNAERLMRYSHIPIWVVTTKEESGISNFLCPVDFSEPSRTALNSAISLAKDFNAKLRVLGVVEPVLNLSPRYHLEDLDEENNRRMEQLEKDMTNFLKDFDFTGVDHTVDLQAGNVALTIVNMVKNNNHDLLIMGTTGRSGLKRVLMGSVTNKVTRELPCSFITTKSKDILHSKFYNDVKEIERHFKKGLKLADKDKNNEAIREFTICLRINNMYIPAIYKLSEVYNELGDEAKAIYYNNMAKELLTRLWDEEIEHKIRSHYKS